MRFFEAAADWADRMAVDVKFSRDEFDGWFAIASYSDARGPYSAMVNAIAPRAASKTKSKDGSVVKHPAETDDEFRKRVDKMMAEASTKAHRSRIRSIKFARAA